jgi:hypothetical protein
LTIAVNQFRAIGSYHSRTRTAGLSRKTTKPPCDADQVSDAGYLHRNLTQMNRFTFKDAYHQPRHVADTGDAFVRSQLHKLSQPVMVQLVDPHGFTPCKSFVFSNNFTQVGLAKKSLFARFAKLSGG